MTHSADQLHRAVAGDQRAVKAVLESWWPRIQRWSRQRLRDPHLADEACQESIVRVLRFIRGYDPARPFGPWLKTIVHNCAADVAKRHRHPVLPSVEPQDPPKDESRRLDLTRAAARAVGAFDRLPPRQRELVTRVDLRGESASEVAADLGLTPGAVRNQLHTARRALRTVLLRDPELLSLVRDA